MKKFSLSKIARVTAGAFAGAMLTVSLQAVADKSQPSPLPLNELRTFAEVFGRIKQDYVEPVEDKKLINDAIRGMLTGLDPHSDFMDEEEFKELREGTQGEFGGLGIEIGAEDGLVKVIAPIEDTPAQQAGIKSGDLIIKIDDTPVRGLSLTDAVKKMRGKPGSKVTLTVARKTEAKPLVFTLTRAIIKTRSVKSRMLEPGYGYVRVAQFQERTAENLVQALETLYKDNKAPLKGLVLDLRNDPGGLLNGAVGVSAAFLPKNTLVVYTEGRTEDAKMRLNALPENYLRQGERDYLARLPAGVKEVPLVVLVNAGSASASEIVAGALQDHKRAVVVGTQTFGKGSVQSVLPLAGSGGIKLTTARYFTPNGRSIQAKGITPDVEVAESTVNGVNNPLRVREADLDHHLANPQDKGGAGVGGKPQPSAAPAPNGAEPDKPVTPAKDDKGVGNDYQLSQALNILKVQQILMQKQGKN